MRAERLGDLRVASRRRGITDVPDPGSTFRYGEPAYTSRAVGERTGVVATGTTIVRNDNHAAQATPETSKTRSSQTFRRDRAGVDDDASVGSFTAHSEGQSGSAVANPALGDSNVSTARRTMNRRAGIG